MTRPSPTTLAAVRDSFESMLFYQCADLKNSAEHQAQLQLLGHVAEVRKAQVNESWLALLPVP